MLTCGCEALCCAAAACAAVLCSTGQLEYASKQLMISVHANTGGFSSMVTGHDGGLLIPLDEMAASFWSDSAVGEHAAVQQGPALPVLTLILTKQLGAFNPAPQLLHMIIRSL